MNEYGAQWENVEPPPLEVKLNADGIRVFTDILENALNERTRAVVLVCVPAARSVKPIVFKGKYLDREIIGDLVFNDISQLEKEKK